MPRNETAIVPATGPLSWGAITAKVEAKKEAATQAVTGRVLRHGEMRAVTREEEQAALYGLDAHDHYGARTVNQLVAMDKLAEAYARHKEKVIDRGNPTNAREAITTAGHDFHNAGSFLADLLFGE